MYYGIDFSPYPWMEYAFLEYGVRERAGRGNTNPNIAAYLASVGLSGYGDETPWCSAFVNWCMEQAGIRGTRRANARSWMTWDALPLGQPAFGCVTVFWRDSPRSWKGHVAFYAGSEGSSLLVLGGNQSNAVSIAPYPRRRVLGYRWPTQGGIWV
jgi:uncharacterized protein (TIGR02594 family)